MMYLFIAIILRSTLIWGGKLPVKYDTQQLNINFVCCHIQDVMTRSKLYLWSKLTNV